MEDTLAHELVHAFDHCRFKVDWGNLRHHACSEVRIWGERRFGGREKMRNELMV